MHYEITPAHGTVRKQLNATQRGSSMFSFAPRIGTKTLRRGQKLKLEQEEFLRSLQTIKQLFNAQAIEILAVDKVQGSKTLRDVDNVALWSDVVNGKLFEIPVIAALKQEQEAVVKPKPAAAVVKAFEGPIVPTPVPEKVNLTVEDIVKANKVAKEMGDIPEKVTAVLEPPNAKILVQGIEQPPVEVHPTQAKRGRKPKNGDVQ